MAATSAEIGIRWILRCLVVVAGFDQLPSSRLNCSNRACRTSPTRLPVSRHIRMIAGRALILGRVQCLGQPRNLVLRQEPLARVLDAFS